jgi:uncharacterized protein YndB with AHSA1/START domain
MPPKSKKVEPIVHSVWVDCAVDDAFRLFTEGFGAWWPLAAHSLHREDAERCALEPWLGGRVFERTRDGREEEWGAVISWEPPVRLEFTWRPGQKEDPQQTVEVEFQTEAYGTRVTLTHHGWERAAEPSCMLGGSDWNAILQLGFARTARQQLVAV